MHFCVRKLTLPTSMPLSTLRISLSVTYLRPPLFKKKKKDRRHVKKIHKNIIPLVEAENIKKHKTRLSLKVLMYCREIRLT